MLLDEARELSPQLAGPGASLSAPAVQAEAEGVKEATPIAWLPHTSPTPDDQLPSAFPHLQRSLVAIVSPCVLMAVARLLEVRTRLRWMWSVTLVALLRPCDFTLSLGRSVQILLIRLAARSLTRGDLQDY